jgi:hypothetical protein
MLANRRTPVYAEESSLVCRRDVASSSAANTGQNRDAGRPLSVAATRQQGARCYDRDVQAAPPNRDDARWVLLAVAGDGDAAERWASALDAAGIETELRIGDAAHLTPRSSVVIGANPAPDQLFAFPLYVRADQRHAATTVLLDQGWDGRFGQVPSGGSGIGLAIAVRGALLATLAGGALALLLLWRGL